MTSCGESFIEFLFSPVKVSVLITMIVLSYLDFWSLWVGPSLVHLIQYHRISLIRRRYFYE